MRFDVAIIGAGFAGASTAFHLSVDFPGSICILEKESFPDVHSSGRNASLVRQAVQPLSVSKLITASTAQYHSFAEEVGFNPCGSLLFGPHAQLDKLKMSGCPIFPVTPSEFLNKVPLLEGFPVEAMISIPSDGIMDISNLQHFYLRKAESRGVQIRYNFPVLGIARDRDHFLLHSADETISAEYLVNAAGAWANEVARMSAIPQLPIKPLKRHIFLLDVPSSMDSRWPFAWGLLPEFYFRPESNGLLFCLCDEEDSQNLIESVNPEIRQILADFVFARLPALRQARIRKVWSGFRTRSVDGAFVIGPDPQDNHFFWVAGLGGHGMCASWEVGRLAALLFGNTNISESVPFLPSRFFTEKASREE